MKYALLASVCASLESTTKRLEKTALLSALLGKTSSQDLPAVILLVRGKVFPPWDERKIGVAEQLVIRAIAAGTGHSLPLIQEQWKKTGDLGDAASFLMQSRQQQTLFTEELSLNEVYLTLRKLAAVEGPGSVDIKVNLIAKLLTAASPDEARYIVRTVLEEMRVGIGEGTLRDAIVWAFLPQVAGLFDEYLEPVRQETSLDTVHGLVSVPRDARIIAPDEKTARSIYTALVDAVQHAYDMVNDFGTVAQVVQKKGLKGLEEVQLEIGKPIKVMLFKKAKDMEDALTTVGKPAALEFKYDGFRMQIHKKGSQVMLFTRNLEQVTAQFPDVVAAVNSNTKANTCILDGEVVGFDPKTKRYLPFQSISQRIRRRHNIMHMAQEFPVELTLFDIMYHNGIQLLDTPFSQRREILSSSVIPENYKIVLAQQCNANTLEEADAFYQKARDAGQEGVMAKKLDAPYKPG
ncbi:DNA ligase, partial [Candidatus Woesearchaeota archaeon CG_4_10_14_0_8_um_filter_47_5]